MFSTTSHSLLENKLKHNELPSVWKTHRGSWEISNLLRQKADSKEEECFLDAAVCEAAHFSAVPESHIVKWLFSPMDPLIQRPLAEEIFAVSNLFRNDPVVTKGCNSVTWQLLFSCGNSTFTQNTQNKCIYWIHPPPPPPIVNAYKWNSFSGVVTSQRGDKSAARLALRVSSPSLTACPLTRKANCALENIYELGREIGLRSVDKERGDGGEEEKKKEKPWNLRWDRG